MRDDLIMSRVQRGKRAIYVIKDPLSHSFFEMSEEDYLFARSLDPSLDLRAQAEKLRALGGESTASKDDRTLLRHAVRVSLELHARGLAKGSLSFAPEQKPRPRVILSNGLRRISSLLFLRWKLIDPGPFMKITAPWIAPFLRPGMAGIGILFFLLSAGVFLLSGGFSSGDMRWFSTPQSWLALYVGIALMKCVHEWSHAAVIHHFGGNVHDAGVILIAGLPLFYVDASDSYLFRERGQRIAVAAAGILGELLAGALLVWLWWILADGFARQLLQCLIILALVSTLLFNANPLMRYDGYYILADAIGMPDLRNSARKYCSGLLRHLLAGTPPPDATRREAWICGIYGILSYGYLLVVIFSIWRFVSLILEPLDLKWLGHLVIGSWAIGSIGLPTLEFVGSLCRDTAKLSSPWRKKTLFAGLLAIGILLPGLFLPIPAWVEKPCLLEPSNWSVVRNQEEGFVEQVLVDEGSVVQAGQPLLVLRNSNLSTHLAKATLKVQELRAKRDNALAHGEAGEIEGLRRELAAAIAQQDNLLRRVKALTVTSPITGTVQTRELKMLWGSHLSAGHPFCIVLPLTVRNFVIPLDEASARKVKKDALVVLRVRGFPLQKYTGHLIGNPLELHQRIPSFPEENESLYTETTGNLPPEIQSPDTTHFARVSVSDPDNLLKPGMTGRVRISCGTTTPFSALFYGFLEFVRLDVRMR